MDSPAPLSPTVLGSLRSLSLFFLPRDLVSTLTHSTPDPHLSSPPSIKTEITTPLLTSNSNPPSEQQPERVLSFPLKITPSCRTCAVPVFASVDKQREHVKSDWHLYNLKQQLLDEQAEPIPLVQFQDMLLLTVPDPTAPSQNRQSTLRPSSNSTSMALYNSSQNAVQTLMSQLEINIKENKHAQPSDPQLLRQKILQEKRLNEIRRSPFLWFSSTLYGPSVQFGIYKNALANKGQCEHLLEHIKSIQIPMPSLPPKKSKVKRAARAKAKVASQLNQQKPEQMEEKELDVTSMLQEVLKVQGEPSLSSAAICNNAAHLDPTLTILSEDVANITPRYWTLILLGGGHFAGMVVDLRGQAKKAHSQGNHARELKIIAHKTFHRYTGRSIWDDVTCMANCYLCAHVWHSLICPLLMQ
jgi:hypothetical protein